MPPNQALLNEVNLALGAAVNHNLTAYSKACKLYEAFVFAMALEAARNLQGLIAYETASGQPAQQFRFRMGPGYIYSPTDPTVSHAVVSIEGEEKFEIHLDVRVAGRSTVLHEVDVLLLTRAEGMRCRLNDVHPRSTHAIGGAEAKFYTVTLDISLAREFIGLTSDLLRNGCFVTNIRSETIARLLAAKDREWQDDVRPTELGRERVRTYFENAIRNFLARS